MTDDAKMRVAIVGLGFGAEFIPIYQGLHDDGDGRLQDMTAGPATGKAFRRCSTRRFAIETATFKLRDSDVCAE
jgi:hypothetical protein